MQAKDLKPGWWFSVVGNVLLCTGQRNGCTHYATDFGIGHSYMADTAEVAHHPDCTGWDWPIPKRVKLEVGKRYVMRNGGVTEPLEYVAEHEYPWKNGDRSWTKQGRIWNCQEDERDIISEYVEPEPAITVTVTPCDCEHVPFTQTTFKPHSKKWLVENSMPDLWLRAERVRPSGVLVGSSWIEWDRLLSGFRFLGGGVCGVAQE